MNTSPQATGIDASLARSSSLRRLAQLTETSREQSRKDAFAQLSQYSPRVSETAQLITNRLLDSSALRIGELLPALLAQVAKQDTVETRKLGAAWFSLYLYTMLADDQMDNKYLPSAQEIMTSAALLDLGLSSLRSAVQGSRFEAEVDACLKGAIAAQLEESLTCSGPRAPEIACVTSAGKNLYLVAIAAAYGNIILGGEHVVRCTRKILLAVQHLDDLTDAYDDYTQRNFTPLLLKCGGPKLAANSRRELLRQLVSSGALESTLESTLEIMGSAAAELELLPTQPSERSLLHFFIDSISSEVRALLSTLEATTTLTRGSAALRNKQLIDIENGLRRISFSS